ncbi:MAG: acyltransferase [Sandarakinorhabdus sp.]|jgi:acetyltransferase-like isoleucine patch superfamily enzyme|nr:acyltransferase [Sandarakinorhabdus sp.]
MMRRRESWKQKVQRLVRRHVWGMDIQPGVWIAETALIDRTWPRGIHIGKDCVIGEEVVILTHDLTRGIYVDTRIGDGTLIGPRAIILPGVTVGAGCVIQPGALVNRDVPDFHVAQGNPASLEPRQQPPT